MHVGSQWQVDDNENTGAGVTAMVAATPRLALVLACVAALALAWLWHRRETALRHRMADLNALVSLAEDLQRATRTEDVDASVVAYVVDRLGFRRAAVLRRQDGAVTGVLRHGGVDARVAWSPAPGAPVPWDQTHSSRRMAVLDPGTDALLDRLLPWATDVVVVPVLGRALVPTVLAAEWGEGARRLGATTVDAMERAAAAADQALATAVLLAETEWLATRDGLTGLVNRRMFDEALEWAVGGAQRTGSPVSLIVLDLDHFKAVNDTHGHQVGDEVLRGAGQVIAAASRSADIAARYGGDEFALVLPACTGEAAVAIAERLRASVAAEVGPVTTTLSAGVATVPDDTASAEGLLAAADAALYASKREGRDRTTRAVQRQGHASVIRLEVPSPGPAAAALER